MLVACQKARSSSTRCEPFLAALGKRLVGKWKVFLWYPSGEDRGSGLLACCW